MKIKLFALSAGLALAATGAARAEAPTFFGYNLNASIRAEVAPDFEGGKHYGVFPSGNLALMKPGEFDTFSAPDDAATLGLLNTKHFAFGLAASVREARGNSAELQGFHNIGWAVEGGGFMDAWPSRWTRIHVEALKGLTAEDGLEINVGADLVFHPRGWNLSWGPRVNWADERFNNTYFGVEPDEALANPFMRRSFRARSGVHTAGLATMAEYKLRPNWRLTFDASYNRLLGDDAQSPIVRRVGDPNQIQGAVGLRFVL